MLDLSQHDFREGVRQGLKDEGIRMALDRGMPAFIARRAGAASDLPEFEHLRDNARDIKNHVLAHLDVYLEIYEARVEEAGGHVHWAIDAEQAREKILEICQQAGAKTVTKGKSMVGEEIGINEYLEKNDIKPIETDLGEYIIQLRNERPSHIIAPAAHVSREQVEEVFREKHTHLPDGRNLDEAVSLLGEARAVLREQFLAADVGITGANFLIAETGSSIIVTNEGNGDLTQTLPRVHIVLATLEKIVPTLNDFSQIARVLARSATGQEMSVYTTFSTGPKRTGDVDGPEEYHVILLDNGRSSLLGTKYQEVLRCIRCGSCMNHCPVYHAIGGHAYGSVYPGPIGSALSPALFGLEHTANMPNASTFCGRCEEVCPMRIPLPKIMRYWREEEFSRKLSPTSQRLGLRLWAFFAKRPGLYHLMTSIASRFLRLISGGKGHARRAPLAGGWTEFRELPTPTQATFLSQIAAGRSESRN